MSSKINLQTCEYARKSSIFQDNQLIWKKYKGKYQDKGQAYLYTRPFRSVLSKGSVFDPANSDLQTLIHTAQLNLAFHL